MKNSRAVFLKGLLVAGLIGMFGWAVAQTPVAPTPETSTQNAAPQASPQLPLATLDLIVTDKANHALDNIDANQLQVFEDGKLQKLVSAASEERPVVYAIAFDNSLSFKEFAGNALAAARVLIEKKKAVDETEFIRFVSSDKIETVLPFTTERAVLLDNLEWFFLEGGQSAVIDAVYLSVQSAGDYEAHQANPRRAVVLISDGEDKHSYYTNEQLVKLLRETHVQVFVIGIVIKVTKTGSFNRPNPREAAERFLHRIAQESGGRLFLPRNLAELAEAANEIAHDLRTQFAVTYERSDIATRAGFHKVEVKVLEGKDLTAITRPGYLVNGPKEEPKKKEKKSK
jgi:Ca-activated chloride channel family protein